MSQTGVPNGKYLYCVLRSFEPIEFATRGIGERGDLVHTINVQGLAAVVSDAPVVEFDETRRNMMAHTQVLEETMRTHVILPVRFGTVAPDTRTVEEKLLVRRRGELNGLLNEMEGRIELGLKAFWYEGAIFKEIVEENAAIGRLRESLVGRTTEETYYDRIHLGEMVEAAMWKKRDQDAEAILSRLRPLVYKTRANKVITDRMVLNAAFLLDRSREPEFDGVVRALDAEMGQRLIFKYVGPVPPYNFVNIVVHWNE